MLSLDDLEVRATVVIKELQTICDPGITLLRMPDGSVAPSSDFISTIKPLRRTGEPNDIIRTLIIDGCRKAEAYGPGSAKFLVRFLSKLNPDTIESYKTLLEILPRSMQRVNKGQLQTCLDNHVPTVASLVWEALELAGSECKVFSEPSTVDSVTVERLSGHSLNVRPDPSMLKEGKWSASGVKCLIVDGIVDSVSEIDGLLSACHRTKRPMVIFARGFSNDVYTTLRVNHARGTLNVMPVKVEFDLATVNILNDVAVILGSDVISSLKGDLISTVKLDDLPIADRVSYAGSLTLHTPPSLGLTNHLQNLVEKRAQEMIPEMRVILDTRIRSLSASSVVIRVPNHGLQGTQMMSDIDQALKLTQSILRHGVISTTSLSSLGKASGLLSELIASFQPALSVMAGLKIAISTYAALRSSLLLSCQE